MRTRTILRFSAGSRWTKAALAGVAAASLLAAALHAEELQTPAAAAPAADKPVPPPPPEAGQMVVPEGTPREYTIQKGDTLWDLSQKFLNNPWYWPKIWSLNPSIENPHWIYPGNLLKIVPGAGGAAAPAEAQATAASAEGQVPTPGAAAPGEEAAQDTGEPAAAAVAAPEAATPDIQVVSRASGKGANTVSVSGKLAFVPPPVLTVRTSGIASPEEISSAGSIDASFEEKQMLATFDTAYVRYKGDAPVKAGDKLVLFTRDGDVIHPITKLKIAEKTKTVGVAKVLTVKGTLATVQIERTFEEINRGDLVRPWVAQEKRIAPRANKTELSGIIVSALNPGLSTYGEANEVFIDKGTAEGVEEGNTFAVVRRGDGLNEGMVKGANYVSGEGGANAESVKVPDENIGLLLVVDAREHFCTAIVIKSIRELQAGDEVEMHPGSPPAGSGGP